MNEKSTALLLEHRYEGVDIQLQWAERTLSNLVKAWGRPVAVQTAIEGKGVLLKHDGTEFTQEKQG